MNDVNYLLRVCGNLIENNTLSLDYPCLDSWINTTRRNRKRYLPRGKTLDRILTRERQESWSGMEWDVLISAVRFCRL